MASKTCKINLHWPDRIREAMRDVFAAADRNLAVQAELENWLAGHNGPALIVGDMKEGLAIGTYDASLQFSEEFHKFVDAIRIGVFASAHIETEALDNE